MNDDDIYFIDGDPPRDPRRPRTTRHLRYAHRMRQQPGRWCCLTDVDPSTAYDISNGAIAAYRPGGTYEAHKVKGKVYARYIGGGGCQPQQ